MLDLSGIWPEWTAVEELGEGSYGKVYKCVREERGIRSECAVKVITIPRTKADVDGLLLDGLSVEASRSYFSEIVDDFANEIRVMEELKGAPGIVAIEDYKIVERTDRIGWDIYIRMELLTPFKEYAQTHEITRQDVVTMALQLCEAMEICSEQSILHRDIKPENIFVDRYNKFKLGDFGVAKQIEKTMGASTKKGTYSYMAPEVNRGEHYDIRADIYSLGMVMYRLLNNNRDPFVDPQQQMVSYRQRADAMQRRFAGEQLPEPIHADADLARIILKCCAFDPNERYGSFAALANDLNAIGNYPKLTAFEMEPTIKETQTQEKRKKRAKQDKTPQENTKTSWKRIPRKPLLAAVALVLVASVLFGIIKLIPFGNDNTEEDTTEQIETYAGLSGNVKVGESVVFGSYGIEGEQAQPIEWTVLDRRGNQVLLLSNKGLDYQSYHGDSGVCFTWETAWIREWLNTDFYDAAFSEGEKNKIVMHENTNPDNPVFGTSGGNTTHDRCFLLSMQEVEKYFPVQEQRIAECTDAVFYREFKELDWDDKTIGWMLRSPGLSTFAAEENMTFLFVSAAGSFESDLNGLQYSCIRPAVWVDISKNARHASEEWTGGYREHLYDFSWDLRDGVLTLSGNGVMPEMGTDEWDDEFRQSVKSVVIEEGFTTIAGAAFMDFVNLVSVQIPEGVEEIGAFAFRNCPELKKISLPSSVMRIGQSAFYLSGVAANKDYWKNGLMCIDHCLIRASKSLTGNIDIPDSITVIGEFAFYECNIVEVEIPKGVTRLDTTFTSCADLVSVNLPDSIRWINGAFDYCESLQSIHLPEDLEYILDGFYACESLQEIVLPQKLKYIGEQAFSGCFGLTNVTLYPGIEYIGSNVFFNTSLDNIDFYGTESEWNNIQIESDNDDLFKATRVMLDSHEISSSEVEIGETIEFGSYEQDNNVSNGKEPIEWIILDRYDDAMLVISKYGLDSKPYNETYDLNVTWETCTLRSWLNTEFINEALIDEEQSMLQIPSVVTGGDFDIEDKVFLLCESEALQYFDTDDNRACVPTDFAESQGVCRYDDYMTADGETTCTWWLRWPLGGIESEIVAAVVGNEGSAGSIVDEIDAERNAVRPALWIKL